MALQDYAFSPTDYTSGKNDILGLFGTGQRPIVGEEITASLDRLKQRNADYQMRQIKGPQAGQDPVQYLMNLADNIQQFDPEKAQTLRNEAMRIDNERKLKQAQMAQEKELAGQSDKLKRDQLAQELTLKREDMANKAEADKAKALGGASLDDLRATYNTSLQHLSELRKSGEPIESLEYQKTAQNVDALAKQMREKGIQIEDITGKAQPIESSKGQPVTIDRSKEMSTVKSMAVDADGLPGIDNLPELRAYIRNLRQKAQVPETDNDYRALMSYVDDLENASQNKGEKRHELAREAKSDERYLAGEAQKLTPVFGVYQRLKQSPNDQSVKADALTRLLRDESGAAIAASEFVGRLQTVLGEKDYKDMMSELGGVKGAFAHYSGNDELFQTIVRTKYLGKMDANKMGRVLADRVIGNPEVLKYMEKNYSKSVASQGLGQPTVTTRRKATLADFK